MSGFSYAGLRRQRFGVEVLSLVRADYVANRRPSDFTVLIHNDDDGYTFSETFSTLDPAERRYEEKLAEFLRDQATSSGNS